MKSAFGVGLVLSLALLFAPIALLADPSATAAKLETLLKASGYKSAAKVNDTTWTLDFSGKRIPKFKLVLTATDKDTSGIITAIVNPVAKSEMPKNRTALTGAVLKANNDFDYVKLGFDAEGDVFVRADIPSGADAASFKTVVEQVAAAADEFYGRIKPLLR